ncbi:hypothetical protein ACQP2E_01840 [Actinoplanes sp. CA-015351]|uniref:hypothetical protein n=1 Tax=Actinoplanes sp. CA-015351 TaxID=3239897 RepID=UPI003D993D3C
MIRMIGGEMPEYAEEHPPARGLLYRHLTSRLPAGAEVLVAGPHDVTLLAALSDGRKVTCLVRSQPDAKALSEQGYTVLCGSLAKLTGDDQFDAVVALDGTARLCSPEGPQLDWTESVRTLKRALRPGGTLLLTVENELGVHRLVDTGTPTAPGTSQWRPLGEFGTAPGRADRLAAALGAEGMQVSGLAAAWPSQSEPTLLVTPETLRYGPLDALAALAAATVADAYQEKAVLSDPRRLASAAVRRGLGAELAPAWIAVAQLTTRSANVVPIPPVSHLSGGTIVEGSGHLLPTGRLLEELLLTAALGHDLPALRRLLTGWMTAAPDADAANVLVDGERYILLDPNRPEQPDALARFANTLFTGGYDHPWPAVTDVARLLEVLAGAAGVSSTPAVVPPSGTDSRREREQQLEALRRQLADAEARSRFFEVELEKRDAELGRAKVQIAAFSGSLGFRAAKAGLGLARQARNSLRKGRS